MKYSGHELLFTLTTATVEEAVFAVGYVPLPEPLEPDLDFEELRLAFGFGAATGAGVPCGNRSASVRTRAGKPSGS